MRRLMHLALFGLVACTGLGCATTEQSRQDLAAVPQKAGSPFEAQTAAPTVPPPTPAAPPTSAALPTHAPTLQTADAYATSPTSSYRGAPALLFSPHPGPAIAQDFTYRPPWPAVRRPYDNNDVIFYTESVRDYEGLWGAFANQTIVRYRSYRVGAAARGPTGAR